MASAVALKQAAASPGLPPPATLTSALFSITAAQRARSACIAVQSAPRSRQRSMRSGTASSSMPRNRATFPSRLIAVGFRA